MALLTALFASALSIGLGLSLVLLATAEMTLAAHDRDARALRYAARAAAAIAVSDLRALPSWTDVGAPGAVPEMSAAAGRFIDVSLSPPAPWSGEPLDLRALTAQLQAESGAGTTAGPWRLFTYGSMPRVADSAAPWYLVAWVAGDGGVVRVRASALGPGDTRADTEIALVRTAGEAGDLVRTVSVRPGS